MKSLHCLLLLVGAAVLLQAEDPSNYHVSVELKPINADSFSGSLLYDGDDTTMSAQERERELIIFFAILFGIACPIACAASIIPMYCGYRSMKKDWRRYPSGKVPMKDVWREVICRKR